MIQSVSVTKCFFFKHYYVDFRVSILWVKLDFFLIFSLRWGVYDLLKSWFLPPLSHDLFFRWRSHFCFCLRYLCWLRLLKCRLWWGNQSPFLLLLNISLSSTLLHRYYGLGCFDLFRALLKHTKYIEVFLLKIYLPTSQVLAYNLFFFSDCLWFLINSTEHSRHLCILILSQSV